MSARLHELKAAATTLAAQGIDIDVTAFSTAWSAKLKGALHLVDLALAWACAQGETSAIVMFEREYFPQATRALRRMKLSATLTDDVLGWMRFELFARPRGALIASYSGRGDLGSWVRSIAVHEALKRARRQRREVTPDEASEMPMPEPELAAMRGAYGVEFTRALKEGFAALTAQQRNLLRQYFLDGLSIDVLAGLYGIHRATAARRVAAARTELVDRVKAALLAELELSEAGVNQVITLSNLNESLGQLLKSTKT